LTQRLDLYPIEGNKSSETIDPFNYHPLFTKEQLVLLSRAAQLSDPSSSTEPLLDAESLHDDIRRSLLYDPLLSPLLIALATNQANNWTVGEDRLVHYLRKIFIFDAGNLRSRILKQKHDHILASYFG